MKTPIVDFVKSYEEREPLRLHMPGHKGLSLTGYESGDITEIAGADSLYEASGIIRESEDNASCLFGSAKTLFSTEGSSQCIRAMLSLVKLHAKRTGKAPSVLAARNVHKTFLTAVGLLNLDVRWMPSLAADSYLSCVPDWDCLEQMLEESPPAAVYVTSPDYLGNRLPLQRLSRLCHRYGALLLVDNAHGAYLKFLPKSEHPLDLGTDLCCDSAHKTLPALTGAAYLHVGESAPKWMREEAKDAMALFGSTSPSYLILQSLDRVNAYLDGGYREKLSAYLPLVESCRADLQSHGLTFVGNEPMKLTVDAKAMGYLGTDLARLLGEQNVECEFADPDFLVLMLSCEQGADGLEQLTHALATIKKREPICNRPPVPSLPRRVLSIRDAMFSPSRWVCTEEAKGEILASLSLSCPPAVPIAVCGEQLDDTTVDLFRYYGIEGCRVVCQ